MIDIYLVRVSKKQKDGKYYIENVYTINTADNEREADRKAKLYSRKYQDLGLYNVGTNDPEKHTYFVTNSHTHIVKKGDVLG